MYKARLEDSEKKKKTKQNKKTTKKIDRSARGARRVAASCHSRTWQMEAGSDLCREIRNSRPSFLNLHSEF